jgi:hypothetical protein
MADIHHSVYYTLYGLKAERTEGKRKKEGLETKDTVWGKSKTCY